MSHPSNSAPPSANQYSEVEIIRDPDGVIASITERTRDGRVSFMLCQEFDVRGVTKRSHYLSHRHIPALRRLLADLEERLEILEDRARARRRPMTSGDEIAAESSGE